MSYEKYTWQNGEVITAEKLNHMEEGIGEGGRLVVTFSTEDRVNLDECRWACDKTFAEIKSAVDNNVEVVGKAQLADGIWYFFNMTQYAESNGVVFDFIQPGNIDQNEASSTMFVRFIITTENEVSGRYGLGRFVTT